MPCSEEVWPTGNCLSEYKTDRVTVNSTVYTVYQHSQGRGQKNDSLDSFHNLGSHYVHYRTCKLNIVIGQGSFHSPLGWCEKRKFGKLYCPQMKLGACHKNKMVLEKDFVFFALYTSYGCRAISDNMRKCIKCACIVHFGAFLLITLKLWLGLDSGFLRWFRGTKTLLITIMYHDLIYLFIVFSPKIGAFKKKIFF